MMMRIIECISTACGFRFVERCDAKSNSSNADQFIKMIITEKAN